MTATAAESTAALGTLPTWDLSDLYTGPECPRLRADLERVEREAQAFYHRHAGKLPGLSGKELGQAIATYEALDETLTRIMSYAGLLYAGDQSDGAIARFYQSMQEKVTAVSVHLLFFTLELNQLSDKAIDAKLKAPEAQRYAAWLRDVRIFRPHQLSDELERFLHEKAVVGRNAWTRLFDETMASLRFRIDGRDLTSAEALNLLSAPEAEVRRAAAVEIGAVLGRNIKLFTLITNTLAKDKEIEDKWRRYDQPWSARNLSNRVEDAVVEALVGAVKDSYPSLSHRYYKLKAKWFGGDTLEYWDRNAPLPDVAERTIPWDEAREIVLSSYARFSPDLAGVGRQFFDNAWIDAAVRLGKNPGAFAHPTVPSAHPYLLVNYMGKTRDVMTLAHELGHGVHQVLAGGQGHLQSDTPLTLAETASVFGEMLTFRGLLAAETDPARRRALLAGKVEDMLNTVVRQTAFYDFERRVHAERRQGELSEERLGAIWLAVQTESLGPALQFDTGYATYWSYIPHFIHSPFYVYAYAFGDCLVNSLYAAFEEASAHNGSEAFARRYLEMLAAGGTKRHKELLAPFGLDATDPAFWHKGLGMLKGFIDELEALG
ncbi:M3 family oligoendopeptidase [Nitrospirillum sp. BR 11828]|uniref:M3 family oligoendopeptidase n=1 Tax=Nitrospirillum sp. BR 11828 TaxID=3104325 RepID=UPI002ACAE6C0|nr:M3 family oligoendopeptidase [Nitrospirillum sp. BR 11828]MDZ5646124.1 M3 family oligoendopeptidase [Nitrospirillum sp. BR 11828]